MWDNFHCAIYQGSDCQIICLMGCIILLSMLKNFISHGVSIAITEWFLNHADDEERLKVVRWFANGKDIMDSLKRIENNTSSGDK